MATLPDYLIVALAAWRLAYALVYEDAFVWLRVRLRVREVHFTQQHYGGYETNETKRIADNVLGKLLTCVYCSGAWISGGFVLLWVYRPELQILIQIFAVAGVVNLIQRWHQRG